MNETCRALQGHGSEIERLMDSKRYRDLGETSIADAESGLIPQPKEENEEPTTSLPPKDDEMKVMLDGWTDGSGVWMDW